MRLYSEDADMIAEALKPGKILGAIVGADYDYICLIDMVTRSYEIFTGRPNELIPQRRNDYDAERTQNTYIYVVEQDRERLLQEMNLDFVSEKLKTAEKFSTAYGMTSDAGLQYKEDTFFYLDDTHQEMVLMRKDVTQLTCRQQDDMARLRKTLMELEQASEAKSVFLSNMSHDLRTPLNGILGFAAIGMQKESAAEKQECLQKIKMSGDLLLGLVNDTLELSRIESGKYHPQMEVISCGEACRPILVSIQQSAYEKQVHFIANTESFPKGMVRTDRMALQKILLNLLSNAVKFTPAGGTVRYTVEAIDPPVHGMTRRMTVEDTGIGMSPEFQKHLFEPFSQERRPETAEIQGTGLGLSIVKRMVDFMGGTIAVQSEIGKGTRFTVELPLECVTDDAVSTAAPKALDDQRLAGKRILLCEDNSMNAEITTLLLKEKKMLVECAVNGKQGAEQFAAAPAHYYDAVLMDIRMPVMDGFQAARAIRMLAREDASLVPIIAMTADAFDESVRQAEEAGMSDYLTKPVDPQKLYQVLAEHLSRS
jgi:signal transduction histidine kinase/BarA-like signal transduction histidine kinase